MILQVIATIIFKARLLFLIPFSSVWLTLFMLLGPKEKNKKNKKNAVFVFFLLALGAFVSFLYLYPVPLTAVRSDMAKRMLIYMFTRTIKWVVFFNGGALLLTLLIKKELNIKNTVATLINIGISLLAAYGYFFCIKAFTDMRFFAFEEMARIDIGTYALIMFFSQTAFLLLWFKKSDRALILSLIAASGLSLIAKPIIETLFWLLRLLF